MNTIITPNWVTKDVATNWKNNIKLVGNFDRGYDDSWKNKPGGAQIGYTVQQRIQQRWVVTEGLALQQQAILNQTVPITLNHQFQIGMGWSSADKTLLIEEVQERYTKPAGAAMANKADVVAGAEVYKSVYFNIGKAGLPITDNGTYMDGVAKLRNAGVPGALCAVVDPKAQAKITAANLALFNLPGGTKMFESGQFGGPALGVDEWYWDPNMPTHVSGTFASSTPIVSGAGQTGSTLLVSGLNTFALKAGDTFTLDGVFMVNPVSYINTNELQQFVLVTDASGAGPTVTLTISPAIITGGQLQTVTNSPANGASVLFTNATSAVTGTMAATNSRQSLIFHPSAFAFVQADLVEELAGAKSKRVSDADARISMRWVEQYSIQTDQQPSRVDMIVGVASVLPYFALRAWN